MATTRPNPLLIPTLTDVVSEGSPALDSPPTEIMPDVLAEKVLQIVQPQIAEIIHAAIVQVLEEQKRVG
ncbi:MAG: hypothetical protein RIR79_1601 [Pseudomonadota bacterium]|jgi:hypothetical protein